MGASGANLEAREIDCQKGGGDDKLEVKKNWEANGNC